MRFVKMMRKKTIGLVVVTLALVIAVPSWIWGRRLMRLGYVDSAIGSMRVLLAAETKYTHTHPQIGYTCTLSDLPAEDLTTGLVRNGRRNEYLFEIIGCGSDTSTTNSRYQIKARPLLGGMPAFCADQSGIVKYDDSGSADKCLVDGSPIG